MEETEEEILRRIKKENIVLTLKINSDVPLFGVSCEYSQFTRTKPEPSSALVLRILTPDGKKISINIFPSGKVVVTGAKDVFGSYSCIFTALNMIQKYVGGSVKIKGGELSLRNIVMTVSLGKKIDIDSLARDNPQNVELDRKKFPGAIMSLDCRPTANIFDTGNYVLPGPSNAKVALECVKLVQSRIRNYIIDEEAQFRGNKKIKLEEPSAEEKGASDFEIDEEDWLDLEGKLFNEDW